MKTVRNLLNEKGTQVWSAPPETPVFEALRLMADKDIGALVVLEADKIAGILSIGDVVSTIISDQEEALQHMERMARGEGNLLT